MATELSPNEAGQMVLVGYADHGGRPTGLKCDENTPSGQEKGRYPIYLTREAVRKREADGD